MYLIMELCRGGEVSDELRKRGYFKEEVSVNRIAFNLCIWLLGGKEHHEKTYRSSGVYA